MSGRAGLIIFDVDGTLVDSQATIVACAQRAFSAEGLRPPPAEAVRRIVGLSLTEAMTVLLGRQDPVLAARIAQSYRDAFLEYRLTPEFQEPLFPGARAILERLRDQEVPLGVATGKAMRGLRSIIERHGLEGFFQTLQTADLHPSKPHPAMVEAAMAEVGVAPGGTMMVGDTTYDILMARAAGADGIGVGWGNHPPAELEAAGASAVLDRFADLEPLALGRPEGSMRRFYKEVAVRPEGGGHVALLDGRPILTPARRPVVVPRAALALTVAEEWRRQAEEVVPDAMPATRLATTAIDLMPGRRDDAILELVGYGETDLLCYRAAAPATLVALQERVWQPWLDWAERELDARLLVARSIEPLPQPETALRALRLVVEQQDDWRLVGLHAATTLMGSLVLGLAMARGRLGAAAGLEAALLDELFEIEQWGREAEQQRRHARLRRDLEAAEAFLRDLEA